MKPMILTAATLCLTTSFSVNAATERDLDSHVHGGAALNIAFDGNELYIELESPWMNLVGFEHEPSTDEQRNSVAESIQQLQNGNELFTFVGTQCDMEEAVVENSMDDDHEGEHDEDHEGEHGEEHEGEHDEDHEGEHDEDHGDHEGGEHSAVMVSYVFSCSDLQDLETVDVELFSVWSGFEDIDVQLAGPTSQNAMELDPDNRQIDMTSVL